MHANALFAPLFLLTYIILYYGKKNKNKRLIPRRSW